MEGAPESLQEKENKAAEAEESGEAEAKKPEAQKKKEPGKTTEQKSSADTNEMTKQDEDVQQPKTGKAISVTISSGDGSYTVAKKLVLWVQPSPMTSFYVRMVMTKNSDPERLTFQSRPAKSRLQKL